MLKMKKQVMVIFVLVLLLNSLFAVAETTSSDTSSDCNWWCKVKTVFGGNVVGKGYDSEEELAINSKAEGLAKSGDHTAAINLLKSNVEEYPKLNYALAQVYHQIVDFRRSLLAYNAYLEIESLGPNQRKDAIAKSKVIAEKYYPTFQADRTTFTDSGGKSYTLKEISGANFIIVTADGEEKTLSEVELLQYEPKEPGTEPTPIPKTVAPTPATVLQQDWSGDQEFSGLPGEGQLSIEDGKLVLDCGTWCVDKPLEVNPSTGKIKAWTSEGWVDLTDNQVKAIPDVQAKRDLLAKQKEFTTAGKAYTSIVAKASTTIQSTEKEELTKLEDTKTQKKTLEDFESTLRTSVNQDSSITDKDTYIKQVMDAKKEDLQNDIDAQKAKVKQLEDLHKTVVEHASEDKITAQQADSLIAEAQTIDGQIKAKTDLANLKGLPTDEKKKLDDQIADLKEKSKDKKEEADKLKKELEQTTTEEQGAAATPPTGAAAPTKSCDTIEACQTKLKDKELTHGQAYDAMKSIADESEKDFKEKKEKYDKTISDLGDKVKDGKIPNTVTGSALDTIAKNLGIERKNNGEFNVGEIITGYGSGKEGQKYKVIEGIIEGDKKYLKVVALDEKDTACSSSNPCQIDVSGIKPEEEGDSGYTRESESDETLRERTQALLDAQKPDETQSKKDKESADSIRWQGTWWDIADKPDTWYSKTKGVGSILSGGFELVGTLGSYRALSNLLFPDTTKAWSEWANDETLTRWADLPNFAAAEACDADDAKRANQPGQAAAFITTTAGTHQFVGAINAEKSPTKFPILCRKNKAEEWVCPKDLVCKDNTYCYKDKNADKPEEGYFYKITWGVTAPADEKFTPYVDENGVAAKFNVYLGDQPLYVKKGVTEPKQVLQLTNGGHDGGMIVRYLAKDYTNVCIRFDKEIKDRDGDNIEEICASIISSQGGVVEYASSSKGETVTSTSADVELDI